MESLSDAMCVTRHAQLDYVCEVNVIEPATGPREEAVATVTSGESPALIYDYYVFPTKLIVFTIRPKVRLNLRQE
jgi:hypothetical protein